MPITRIRWMPLAANKVAYHPSWQAAFGSGLPWWPQTTVSGVVLNGTQPIRELTSSEAAHEETT